MYFRFNPLFDSVFIDRLEYSKIREDHKNIITKMILKISAVNMIKINHFLEYFSFIHQNEELPRYHERVKKNSKELLAYYLNRVKKYQSYMGIHYNNIANLLRIEEYADLTIIDNLIFYSDLDLYNLINLFTLKNKKINEMIIHKFIVFHEKIL